MAKKKKRPSRKKPGRLYRFFSRVGGGVIKTGKGTTKVSRRVGSVARSEREAPIGKDKISRRLRELKRLQTTREKELEVEREIIEEEKWEERVELKRPLSERLAETFYKPLKRPAARLVGFFRGLSEDLYKADMRILPEKYISLMLGISLIVGVGAFLLGWLLFSFPLALAGGVSGFTIALVLSRRRPKYRIKGRTVEINQTLPYALRHIATQLSSGIGLPETLTSVSQADYGALSREFGRLIHDMQAGVSMDSAISAMDKRIESEPLRRALRQIQRTLRTGGDLSNVLSDLADETAFDLRMNLRSYTQSLNMMTMVYMFASAVVPAMLIVLLIVMQFMGGGTFSTGAIALLYLFVIPFLLFYLVMTFKRMEPRV
ncbi:MAG: type II secretion system F family protein [Candidatus Hadarchaeota archaeon]|nr:type II secretion system F family protein [Candidatus Hadarchaeota archaeon]